ncbi:MAG: hypothetical protein ABR976_00340 [Terracidiphilus sp.]|jgi:hypothetical protein
MLCPKCQSSSVSVIPAEIRLYRNGTRTMSHPPMTPSPDVHACLDCGWSEFSIPRSWLAAGWLRSQQSIQVPAGVEHARVSGIALVS